MTQLVALTLTGTGALAVLMVCFVDNTLILTLKGMVLGNLPRPPTLPVGAFNPEDYSYVLFVKRGLTPTTGGALTLPTIQEARESINISLGPYPENTGKTEVCPTPFFFCLTVLARIDMGGKLLKAVPIDAVLANTLELCYTQCNCVQGEKLTKQYGLFNSHEVRPLFPLFGLSGSTQHRSESLCRTGWR